MSNYEYNRRPGGLGWTGSFTIPGQEQRFSQQGCTGTHENPMAQGSDLICGRPPEVEYLQSIGCRTVSFQGQSHCMTDSENQGIFFCCPPGRLQEELARSGQPTEPDEQPSQGMGLGGWLVLALALGGGGYAAWKWYEKREEEGESLLPRQISDWFDDREEDLPRRI